MYSLYTIAALLGTWSVPLAAADDHTCLSSPLPNTFGTWTVYHPLYRPLDQPLYLIKVLVEASALGAPANSRKNSLT